uniref:Beta-galactosidase n=1 Tax=Sphenodon punctatus TaxID=8508 RepID=A0A8D0HAV3_SPHPU
MERLVNQLVYKNVIEILPWASPLFLPRGPWGLYCLHRPDRFLWDHLKHPSILHNKLPATSSLEKKKGEVDLGRGVWNKPIWLLICFSIHARFNWSHLLPLQMWGRSLGLQTKDSLFQLEGHPFRIFGGSVHYFRVPREYWRDRMMKMKACGLNTLTTYVPWNLHEAARGKFDFSGILDLEYVVKLGLWVILRPGPYICSEWDLGGLPSWLLRDPAMRLRTTYKGFTEAVNAYFDHLIPKVVSHQYKKGGPIIAVQVENEYGSYAKDPNYMTYVKTVTLILPCSQEAPNFALWFYLFIYLFISEIYTPPLLQKQKNQPRMVMEYWTGWFDSWGGPHNIFDADEMVNTVHSILKAGASINLYMFHGGTNFGFMNGALGFPNYKPDITSYDYDAVLTEAGDYTNKFFKLRQLFSKIIGNPNPLRWPALYERSFNASHLPTHSFVPLVPPPQPIKSEVPVNMESLQVNDGNGQSYGYTLYETAIKGGGQLHSGDHIRDRAQVRDEEQMCVRACVRLFSSSSIPIALAGLIGDVFLNETPLRNFKIYSLEMKPLFMERFVGASPTPTLLAFIAADGRSVTRLCCLLLQGWEKGVVFVNGQNLGRYWKIGPQETLYLPGTWLRPGDNESGHHSWEKKGFFVPLLEACFSSPVRCD